jgi:hypothetical protein
VAVTEALRLLSSSSSATVLLTPLEKKISLIDPLVREFHLLFLAVIDSLTLRSHSTRTNNNNNREEESEEQRSTSMDLSPVHNKNRSGSSVTPHKMNKNRTSTSNSSSIPPLINTNTTVTTACSSSSANRLLRSYSERILSLPFSSPGLGHQSGSGADIRKVVSSLNNCFDEFYHSLVFSSVTDNNYPLQNNNHYNKNNHSYSSPVSNSPVIMLSLVQSLLDLSGLFWNDLFRFLSSSPGTSNSNSISGSRTESTRKKTTNPPLPGTSSFSSSSSLSQQSFFSSFEVFYSSLKIIFLLFDDYVEGETIVEEEQDKDEDDINNGKQTGREAEGKRREEEDTDDTEKELQWLLSRVEIRSSSSSFASGEEQRLLETVMREAFGLEKPLSSSCSSLRVSVSSHWKRFLIRLVEFIHQITSDLFFLSQRSDLPTTDSDEDYNDSDEDNTDNNNTIDNQKNNNNKNSDEGVFQRNSHNLTIFPSSADQQRFQENEEKLLELFLDLLLALKKLRYKTMTIVTTKKKKNNKNNNNNDNNNGKEKQQLEEELNDDRMVWMFVDLFQEDEDRLTDFFSCIFSHSLLSFQLKDRAISLLQEILTTDIGYDYDFVVFRLIISLSRSLLVFFIPSFVFKAR